ncbi:MAG: 30S ribosome-binding factor RbfA [Spirochaetales bacterium]
MSAIRMSRINSAIQSAIIDIIKNNLIDPKLDGAIVSVTKVDTSNDLSHCNVYISIMTNKSAEEAFNAIRNSLPYIRKQTASRVSLRIMPQLHFILDDSIEYSAKIESLIEKIHRDDK